MNRFYLDGWIKMSVGLSQYTKREYWFYLKVMLLTLRELTAGLHAMTVQTKKQYSIAPSARIVFI